MRSETGCAGGCRADKGDYRYLFSLLFFTFFIAPFLDFGQLLFLVLHHFFHLFAAFLFIIVKNITAVIDGSPCADTCRGGSQFICIQYLCIAVVGGSVHLCSAKFALCSIIGYL